MNTLLFDAVKTGDTQAVQALLAKGADVNQGVKNGMPPLFVAVQGGHDAIVTLLLAQPGINITAMFKTNIENLIKMTANSSQDIQTRMADFIKQQKDPAHIIMTPIEIAEVMGHDKLATLLKEKTADITKIPPDVGRRILTFLGPKDERTARTSKAYHKLFASIATREVERQAHWIAIFKRHFPHRITPDMNQWSKQQFIEAFKLAEAEEYKNLSTKQKKLFYLVKEGRLDDLIKLDITFYDLCVTDSRNLSVLIWAAKVRNKAILDHFYRIATHFYLPENFDINTAKLDMHRCTLLHWAVYCAQSSDLVTALIEQGYDINARTSSGTTPLYIAVQEGHADIVDALLAKGADVNQATNTGATPLYSAALNGHAGIVEALLAKGASVNQADDDGATPLWIAAHDGHAGIVEALLAKGAAVNQARNDGTTPLNIAAQNGHAGIVEALLAKGAAVNQARNDGTTPLLIAAQNGHHATVTLLLAQSGIDLTAEFITNKNALIYFTSVCACSSDTKQRMQEFIAKQENPDDIHMRPVDIAHVMGHQDIVQLLQSKSERLQLQHSRKPG